MPIFPYTPTWPIATDLPSNAPMTFQRNFTSLDSMIGVDHVPFNSGNNGGYHTKSTYVAGGVPACAGSQAVLYAKVAGGVTDLYLKHDAVGAEIQMTQLTNGTPVAGGFGQTFLPGGLIMKWGTANIGVASTPVTYAAGFLPNFPTNTLNIQLTPYDGNANYVSVVPATVGPAGFNARANAPIAVYYLAIGN